MATSTAIEPGRESHDHDHIHLPKPSYWPMILGIGFFSTVGGAILHFAGQTMRNAPALLENALFSLGTLDVTLGGLVATGGMLLTTVAIFGWVLSNIAERQRERVEPLGGVEAAKFAMWCFLGTEVVIFGGLIANAVYQWMVERQAGNVANEYLHKFSSLMIVSANTFILLASSLFVVLALSAIQRGDRGRLMAWMGMIILAGAVFLGIQGYEYSVLYHEGFTLEANQYSQAFFVTTGFHGAHVFVGVIWAAVVFIGALRGTFTKDEHMGVEIFGLYWHFVDVVWIFIFTLLYLI
jgi:heme/copper-type cytochrome/quinol oxidase subunit 3